MHGGLKGGGEVSTPYVGTVLCSTCPSVGEGVHSGDNSLCSSCVVRCTSILLQLSNSVLYFKF